MEIFGPDGIRTFSKPGTASEQLVSPHNSASERLTVTRVTIAPGAVNPRHSHAHSEQIWIALNGRGMLLLADGAIRPFAAGQIARFADGEVHGFDNTGGEPFVYIAVTAPPIDFTSAYRQRD